MREISTRSVRNIFTINLNVKKNERVLIFTDDIDTDLINVAELVAKEAKRYTKNLIYTQFHSTGTHGAEPPESLWHIAFGARIVDSLKSQGLLKPLIEKKASKKQMKKIEEITRRYRKDTIDVVIALSYYSTSHTKFRDLLTNICGTRYASMPLFEKSMLQGAMTVNWKRMADRCRKISQRIKRCENIEIRTPNGTYLTASKKGREPKEDTGLITKRGALSNLPAGEVFFAPLEGTANGRLVLEWAPTQKLKSPITLYVEKGYVKKVQGRDRYAKYLRNKLSEKVENGNIAEIGIGTNDKATRPDNILESEKILGTVHIALGDNSSFGGKVRTPFHQDFVFFEPTVVLIHGDGNRDELIRKGKLIL